jgi:hypothetical protein
MFPVSISLSPVAWADDRGAVTALVAVILPVLILLASFVIDVGNWFEHERHLQLQADAGVLAGGQEFQAQACNDAPIMNRARQYSGVSGGNTPLYNPQIGNAPPGNIYENVNQAAYPSQPNQPASDPSPPAGGFTGSPCHDEVLDLKVTETPLPWYFKALGVGGINAHARVSVLQQTTGKGFLPFAVNETAPVAARAYFVDEATQSQLASVALTNTGTNTKGEAVWSNVTPLPVAITKPNIGVIVALSGDKNNTTCPSNSQFVNCFDANPSLVHVQGWSALGTGTVMAARARSVGLYTLGTAGECADGYFSNAGASCTFQVAAKVDVGATPNPAGLTVSAVVAGTTTALTYQTTGTFAGQWTGAATLPAGSAGPNSQQVDLQVKCVKNTTPGCTATTTTTLTDVQRSYAANSGTSGTIHSAVISEGNVGDANSFQVCETGNTSCTHNLVVTIAVGGSLQNAQSVADPLYTMRFGTGTSASQTGAVACPPGGQGGFRLDIEQGCSGTYAINTSDPACTNVNPLPGGTPPPPADCVQTSNGVKSGQFKQGMAVRMASAPCPNNWSKFPNIPAGDPRIVEVFITSYGSFGGSGNQNYPVQSFAAFYVTGWDGDNCGSDDPAGKDQLVGHFIKYINPTDTGGGGTQACNLNSFGTCVVVLTQ